MSSAPIEMSEMSRAQHISGSMPASNQSTFSEARRSVTLEENARIIQTPLGSPMQARGANAEPLSTIQPNEPTSLAVSTTSSLSRIKTGPALGPAIDKTSPVPKELEIEGPVLNITLLLTTGARHPFRLDQKYLKKRNVEVEGNNPVNMSSYKLKELILRDWRDEWEAKPSSPESIRLISMGKLLTDKSKLSDFGFKDGGAPTIVHMTIKPQEIVDEEEANKSSRDREGNQRSPGCRCMIM
ncbi:MAG: hypothetical protein Q9217_004892 [Psora testacea]